MENAISFLIDNLNNADVSIRLESLKKLMDRINSGELERPETGADVNNHIHTTYSFSPYSPAKAVWMAYNSGLATAGIMDHDSISGAEEFIEAGKIVGVATTIGVECRADFSGTLVNGRRINNPDQDSVAYIALHGIPHTQIEKVKEFFKPYTSYRNIRNKLMIEKINAMMSPFSMKLDFPMDVIPVSKYAEGGSITERHILYALSRKLAAAYGKGPGLLKFLKDGLKLNLGAKIEGFLTDASNPHYIYDLLGLLKSELVNSFYVPATLECPDVKDVIAFSKSIGAISAYAYLGDVGDSVTGDKKTQKFEDGYIDMLFVILSELGFNAVTYMPSRNSREQLARVRSLCDKYGFFQISGEDINSSRQNFICEAMRDRSFSNLLDAAWALIGHEAEATLYPDKGMFSAETIAKYPMLNDRIPVFKEAGLRNCGIKG